MKEAEGARQEKEALGAGQKDFFARREAPVSYTHLDYGFVSAGSSGAILVGGQVIVGRIKGVELSLIHIFWKEPSPQTATTWASGRHILAPMAAGME